MVRPGCQLQSTGWWIAFAGTGRRRWFDLFTRDGFRHVSAFCALQAGDRFKARSWLYVDPSVMGLRVEVLTDPEMDVAIDAIARDNGRFLYLADTPLPEPCFVPRFGAYCVSEIERLIGLPPRALRPAGLYRRLLALGAEPAFEEIAPHGIQQPRSAPGGPGGQGGPAA